MNNINEKLIFISAACFIIAVIIILSSLVVFAKDEGMWIGGNKFYPTVLDGHSYLIGNHQNIHMPECKKCKEI